MTTDVPPTEEEPKKEVKQNGKIFIDTRNGFFDLEKCFVIYPEFHVLERDGLQVSISMGISWIPLEKPPYLEYSDIQSQIDRLSYVLKLFVKDEISKACCDKDPARFIDLERIAMKAIVAIFPEAYTGPIPEEPEDPIEDIIPANSPERVESNETTASQIGEFAQELSE